MKITNMFVRGWIVWVGALLLGVSAFFGSAGACSSMGSDKHMGVVKEIDARQGVLTIIDAETGKPIRFTAAERLLKGIKINDKAVVTFKTEGDRLVAKALEAH
ncbi:MAG TPA: hypothetical protein VIK48_01925 [Candidatus Manganitrophaceae bacterium]